MNSSAFYSEGCNFIRHYSNSSLTVRIAALVQGLVLLSAWTFVLLNKPQEPEYLVFVSAFGLAFTGLLYLLHAGYLRATKEYTAAVIDIEGNPNGPVTVYEKKRKIIYGDEENKTLDGKFMKRLVTIHATFSLIGLAFSFCFLVSIVKVWLKC